MVDPGVGSKNHEQRKSVVVKTAQNHWVVGPNNGLFSLILLQEGVSQAWKIDENSFPGHSNTFHGRDIFSPVAANIVAGVPIGSFAKPIDCRELVMREYKPGQVLYVDPYGNAKIFGSIVREHGSCFCMRYLDGASTESEILVPFVKTFGDVEECKVLVYMGSSGFLELAIYRGNAARKFKVKVGDILNIDGLQ